MKLLKDFSNYSNLCYRSKQIHNEPNEAYFFLINHISNRIKINKHFRIFTKGVKLDFDITKCVNKKIGFVIETIKSVITLTNSKELEIINIMITCDKEKNIYIFFE